MIKFFFGFMKGRVKRRSFRYQVRSSAIFLTHLLENLTSNAGAPDRFLLLFPILYFPLDEIFQKCALAPQEIYRLQLSRTENTKTPNGVWSRKSSMFPPTGVNFAAFPIRFTELLVFCNITKERTHSYTSRWDNIGESFSLRIPPENLVPRYARNSKTGSCRNCIFPFLMYDIEHVIDEMQRSEIFHEFFRNAFC